MYVYYWLVDLFYAIVQRRLPLQPKIPLAERKKNATQPQHSGSVARTPAWELGARSVGVWGAYFLLLKLHFFRGASDTGRMTISNDS